MPSVRSASPTRPSIRVQAEHFHAASFACPFSLVKWQSTRGFGLSVARMKLFEKKNEQKIEKRKAKEMREKNLASKEVET